MGSTAEVPQGGVDVHHHFIPEVYAKGNSQPECRAAKLTCEQSPS